MGHALRYAFATLLLFLACSLAWEQDTPPPTPTQETQEVIGLIRGKKWQEALERVGPMAAKSPDSEQVLLLQVAIFQGMGQHKECQEKALAYLAKFTTSPNRDQVEYPYANSLYQTGRKEEAIAYIEAAQQTTNDNTLKKNIPLLLRLWRADVGRIGISLGGAPPATDEDKEALRRSGLRILRMGLEDYYKVYEKYPAKVEELLEGDPPFLRKLPEDPLNPGTTFEYILEGEGYRFPAE